MAKDFSVGFYHSAAWRHCRDAYAKSIGHLCQDCLEHGIYTPMVEVHHMIELTPENINDPEITLNWKNLRGLCRECHRARHEKIKPKRYKVNEAGRVTIL